MTSQEAIIQKIRYYQEKLDRYAANESHDKIVYVLKKLKQLPIRTVHLEQTGIGRTVNALKKLGDEVSEISKSIVMSWKDMVREEEVQNNMESDEPYQEEVEAYRPDEPKVEEDDEQALLYDENEQNDDSEPEAEPSLEAKSSRHAAQEDSDEKHNGFDSESDAEEESQKKVSKNRGKDKADTDKHSDKRHKRKHESSKSRHESHESTSKRHKPSSSKSEHKEKHGEGQSSKSRDKDSSRHSDKDSKKRHEKDDKHHHKESVKSTDKKSKNYDKKIEHHKSVKKSDEQKAEKRHSSEKHHSSDKHHHSDKNEAKHHSQKHSESQEKSSEKETKSKRKDLKRKHEKEPESTPSKKLKNDEFKEPEKPSPRKKSEKNEKTSSATPKSSKSYAPDFSIDSGSGASFAEALGMCSGPSSSGTSKAASSSKKKSVVAVEKNTSQKQMPYHTSPSERQERAKMEEEEEEEYVPSALRQPQLEPLAINIASLLPEITPNYKPLGVSIDTLQSTRRISITDEEALSRAMKNKNQRTKVYSGNKTFGKVESLFDLCVRILQDNIDALEYTGGVPFSILKPVLQRATPDQLFNLEHHNPYLIEDTDDLWRKHCEKDFRTKKREEMESWREMYMRCLQEREARLSAITANIKQSQDKSIPVRTTKLAYVDSVVKPPRNIARKQAKNGTASAVTPSERLQQISKSNEAVKVTVPSAGSRAADRPSTSSSQSNKPKKAPLMAKALQSFKNRFRR